LHLTEEDGETSLLSISLWERLLSAVVHKIVPRVKQEHHSDLASIVCIENLLDGNEVFERLRHLFTFNVQMASVPEVVDPVVAAVVSF